MPSEKVIVTGILRRLNSLPNTYARKTQGTAFTAGLPDIVACHKGKTYVFEVKTPQNRKGVTARQEVELERWRRAGAVAAVVTSWGETEEVLFG